MILIDKTKEEFDIDFHTCSTKKKIYSQCDYCGNITLKEKKNIIAGYSIIKKDCCNNSKCQNLKREDSHFAKYGVKHSAKILGTEEKRKQTSLEKYGAENYTQTEEYKLKYKQTCLAKYGVENAFQSSDIKNKIKQTCLEKYGVENYSQTKECKSKSIETSLQKYGVEHHSQTEEYKVKSKQTCLTKYGVEYSSQSNIIKQKIKDTWVKKYGVDHPFKLKSIREKSKQTCLKNHGVVSPLQSIKIQNKRKKTFLQKYGVEYPLQVKEIYEKYQSTTEERYGVKYYTQTEEYQDRYTATCLQKYGVEHHSQTNEFKLKCIETNLEKYGIPYFTKTNNKTQNSIKDYLNSFGFNFKSNYTILKGKEIDMYDENLKLGIEYCGLFWHTEGSLQPRDKYYHINKYKRCLEQNIRLITIFSDEWETREKQCKSYLKSVLNKNENKKYARNCQVIELDKKTANNFIQQYHIQGSNNLSLIRYGLIYNDEIIGVMSFGRHHRSSKDITLDRLCFKEDYQVIGGAKRLFHYCLKWAKDNNHNKIISWSDNRWSQGNIYNHLKFNLEEELKADYSYVHLNNAHKRLSKQSQKKSTSKCPPDKTGKEWAEERGLYRIWDCGKKRWVFNIK